MTSPEFPHPGCPTTVLPNLPEITSAERLSICNDSLYVGLYGMTLACYGSSLVGLQVRWSPVDYLVVHVIQLQLEGR
jgi:hypothetical protein